MRTIAVVAILCACFMQEVSGELPSATPEIKEEAVTHLTEKKVEKSAEEVKADEEEAAEEAQDAAENKRLDAKAAEFETLHAKAAKLDIEAEKDGASNTTKTAAVEARKEYVDAVTMFAKAQEVKAGETKAAEKAKEAEATKEIKAKSDELDKLDAKAEKLMLEAEKDGASNTTKTAADEAAKEYVDAVKKFKKENADAGEEDEEDEAGEEDEEDEEDEKDDDEE